MMRTKLIYWVAVLALIPPVTGAGETETERSGNVESIDRKLDEIRFPGLKLDNVGLDNLIRNLQGVSQEYDPAGEGVNFVLRSPVDKEFPSVVLHANNLSLRRILQLAVEDTGFQFDVEENAVIVRPEGTRTFDLSFPGGELGELVDVIKQKIGREPNIVLLQDASRVPVPALELRRVTLDQVMSTVHGTFYQKRARTTEFSIDWNKRPSNIGYIYTISAKKIAPQPDDPRPDGFGPIELWTYNIAPFQERFSLDDITTALDVAWEMEEFSDEDVTVRIHQETSLLYVRGPQGAIDTAQNVMNRLVEQTDTLPSSGDQK